MLKIWEQHTLGQAHQVKRSTSMDINSCPPTKQMATMHSAGKYLGKEQNV